MDNDTQENDVSANLSQNALLTRHRSLNTLKSTQGSNFLNRNLTPREMSWQVDSKTTPPTQTSTPVPELSDTLIRISLNCNSKSELIKKLSTIQKLSKEALELTGVNSASTKKIHRKRVSNIKPEGVAMNGSRQKTRNYLRKVTFSCRTKKCGIPIPTSQKPTPRTETEQSKVGVKSNLNSSINKPSTSVFSKK
ncbi:hypothetical protein RI129_012016 [Pyrocoelia pectoralis]|uniref:Uncharacterized protein n=1 Tax=Pyrocoelia pectoralis TaxID=417401 RepID=A0AAN7V913_9COLE